MDDNYPKYILTFLHPLQTIDSTIFQVYTFFVARRNPPPTNLLGKFSYPPLLRGHLNFLSLPERWLESILLKGSRTCQGMSTTQLERAMGKRIGERKKGRKEEGKRIEGRWETSSRTSLLGYSPSTLSLTLLLRRQDFSLSRHLIKFFVLVAKAPALTIGRIDAVARSLVFHTGE